MNLNLGDEIMEQALSKGADAKRFLSQRLSRHLERALGRRIEFWFVLEISEPPANRLHLHGEIDCSATEAKAVRKALRAAGGEWAIGARQRQVKLDASPDEGCVGYAFKDPQLVIHRALRRLGAGPSTSWLDDTFMITQALKRDARRSTSRRARRCLWVATV